jgi:hypothetical protein
MGKRVLRQDFVLPAITSICACIMLHCSIHHWVKRKVKFEKCIYGRVVFLGQFCEIAEVVTIQRKVQPNLAKKTYES